MGKTNFHKMENPTHTLKVRLKVFCCFDHANFIQLNGKFCFHTWNFVSRSVMQLCALGAYVHEK